MATGPPPVQHQVFLRMPQRAVRSSAPDLLSDKLWHLILGSDMGVGLSDVHLRRSESKEDVFSLISRDRSHISGSLGAVLCYCSKVAAKSQKLSVLCPGRRGTDAQLFT